ncbi:MAG: endonuclease/exonuclease/phosphatase family protein [Lentilitoribacter sp.]
MLKLLYFFVLLSSFVITSSQAENLRIATWNINNLHSVSGEALRSRAPIREDNDYLLLQKYSSELGADIIGLQEMGSPAAAERVFPSSDWELLFSDRIDDADRNDIYTAIVVKKGTASVIEWDTVESLSIKDGDYSTRSGVEAKLEFNGKQFWVLNVHLKSSCHGRSLENPTSDDCKILAAQREPLENWIDNKEATGLPVILVGDFNRNIDLHGQSDHLWADIDDADPSSLNLWRLPFRTASQCPTTRESLREFPIDFLVFNDASWELVDQQSFFELLYDDEDVYLGNRLSDHCAVAVDLKLSESAASEIKANSVIKWAVVDPSKSPTSLIATDEYASEIQIAKGTWCGVYKGNYTCRADGEPIDNSPGTLPDICEIGGACGQSPSPEYFKTFLESYTSNGKLPAIVSKPHEELLSNIWSAQSELSQSSKINITESVLDDSFVSVCQICGCCVRNAEMLSIELDKFSASMRDGGFVALQPLR